MERRRGTVETLQIGLKFRLGKSGQCLGSAQGSTEVGGGAVPGRRGPRRCAESSNPMKTDLAFGRTESLSNLEKVSSQW